MDGWKLALVWMLGFTTPMGAIAEPVGSLQCLSRELARGWAMDPADPTRPVAVRLSFWSEGERVVEMLALADQYDPTMEPLLGSTNRGFMLDLGSLPADALRVELELRSGKGDAWSSMGLWSLPAGEESVEIALRELAIETDGGRYRIEAILAATPGAMVTPEVEVEIWGVRQEWAATWEVLAPGEWRVLFELDPGRYPEVRNRIEASGTLLLTFWARSGSEVESRLDTVELRAPYASSPDPGVLP